MKALTRARWLVWIFSKFKVPLIGYVKPKILSIDDEKVIVKIKLRRKTKNHLNSMYFGALAIGADVAGGLHSFYFADKLGQKISFAFKTFKAEFLKRPEEDVIFINKEGQLVKKALEQSMQSKERVNQNIHIEAFTAKSKEKVADFILEMSVKVK